jgi:hypothetical protein
MTPPFAWRRRTLATSGIRLGAEAPSFPGIKGLAGFFEVGFGRTVRPARPAGGLWDSKTYVMAHDLRRPGLGGDLHAALSYRLIRPPRILRRRTFAVVRSVMAGGVLVSVPGGRKFRARCGRWPL